MKRAYKIAAGLAVAVLLVGGALFVRQKMRERAVGFKEGATLVSEEIQGKGRKTTYRFSAEADVPPRELYRHFVDFAHWQEFVPDISYVKVIEEQGNTRVVEMRRYILFLGRELGGRLEYTLHPDTLVVEMKTLNNPHAEVHERWEFVEGARPGSSTIRYFADTVSAKEVPLVMARAWIKDNFVDLVTALRERAHGSGTQG